MRFLSKRADSPILLAALVYLENRHANNTKLRSELAKEQKNFCAYTEKYITEIDSTAVDHLNSGIKYHDNYYNYYTALVWANNTKQDEKYRGATFFDNLFFQDYDELKNRIKYDDGKYKAVNENDDEAEGFIDFLGFNHNDLYIYRQRHIKRLRNALAGLSNDEIIEYLRGDIEQLSFITAIEFEFGLDLSSLL
jgi:hypothetical protein